jgi:hypothetical protein
MSIYYLYKKTHNKTGLQYLGQTKQDPYKYQGSGADWVEHINEYGYDVTTEILLETADKDKRNELGRHYSKLWNVVESDRWANRIPETGGGPGGITGRDRGEEFSKKCVINNTGSKNPSYGIYWWTNGIDEQKTKLQPGPEWKRGRSSVLKDVVSKSITKQHDRTGKNNNSYGRYWWNNGVDTVKSAICPAGYYRGRAKV